MPEYMLLLYAADADEAESARRWAEMPLWDEVTDSLREAGLLIGNGALHPVEAATTVRVRDGQTEVTDGPFAITKEILGGYYLLRCDDLDQALKYAARLPLARYGSVEIRPVLDQADIPRPTDPSGAE
jgi:hypothetical protein